MNQEKEVLNLAKSKIKELTIEMAKWQKVIDAFNSNGKSVDAIPAKRKTIRNSGNTLYDKIINILKTVNEPLTSNDVMAKINETYPNSNYEMPKFSGLFSVAYRKLGSEIVQYKFKNPRYDIKAVYFLKNWWNDEAVQAGI